MKSRFLPRSRMPRRAFLTAAGGLGVGLPFLESLPGRSAWAQGEDPVFSLYLCTACGVVSEAFYPSTDGALTRDGLLAEPDQALSILADYAERMTLVRGLTYPGVHTSCSHAEAYSMALTGVGPTGSGGQATSTGPSIDNIVASKLNLGVDALALYTGMKSGYINERLSFRAAGEVRSAEGNPYQVYKDLLRDSGQTSESADAGALVDYLALRRQSVIDSVREELGSVMAQPRLGELDKQRLQRHLETLRDLELDAMEMAGPAVMNNCSSLAALEADFSPVDESFRMQGMIETVGVLQLRLAAFAFACNQVRVATLQWGDGTDATIYDVPSNSRSWGMHFVSHRMQSDGSVSMDAEAENAHREIDRVRLESFKRGLDEFDALGLLDRTVVYWTNQHADGPSHSFVGVPAILVGSAGGQLKTGITLSGTRRTNDTLLNTLMSVMGVSEADFVGSGEIISELLA